MEALPPIEMTETGGTLRLAWDNRRARTNRVLFWFLVLFWVIWAPATVFLTFYKFPSDAPVLFSIWSVFAWLGTLGIPLFVLRRYSSEWLDLSASEIRYGSTGFLSRKPKAIPLTDVEELRFGCYNGGGEDAGFGDTLSILLKGSNLFRQRQYMVGYWLAQDLKERIFMLVQEFVLKNQIPLKTVDYRIEG